MRYICKINDCQTWIIPADTAAAMVAGGPGYRYGHHLVTHVIPGVVIECEERQGSLYLVRRYEAEVTS